jgi:putative flippase GtrA
MSNKGIKIFNIMTPQFVRFLLAGCFAAAANYGSRFIFNIFFSYSTSIFFAYLVGMLVAFLLMRRHVFDAKNGQIKSQVIKFVAVNIFAVLQTLFISLLIVKWLSNEIGGVENTKAIAHFIGILVPVGTSYIGHKLFTFR